MVDIHNSYTLAHPPVETIEFSVGRKGAQTDSIDVTFSITSMAIIHQPNLTANKMLQTGYGITFSVFNHLYIFISFMKLSEHI